MCPLNGEFVGGGPANGDLFVLANGGAIPGKGEAFDPAKGDAVVPVDGLFVPFWPFA